MSLTKIRFVRKRDGRKQEFDRNKLFEAVKAAFDSLNINGKNAEKVTSAVIENLESEFHEPVIPAVEDIDDLVKEELEKKRFRDVAKAYMVYKQKQVREFRTFMGVRDELKLSSNAMLVLMKRYLQKDESGNIIETPLRLFQRVAKAVASADSAYERGISKRSEADFFSMLSALEFLPNTPTLMNAGTRLGQLSACFVLPIEDSLDSIFDTLKNMVKIHQSGGGTGFDFSRIRPMGDIVRSTMGVASGPVSFLKIYDAATGVIKQGGRRRGANMGILRFDHPDILQFVTVKNRAGLDNFNLSVSVTDGFMQDVKENKEIRLVNPHSGSVSYRLSARDVFDIIVTSAWKTGDPGLVFIDEVNRKNPTGKLGPITATNPCGEQPLHAYESCNLGSINLTKIVRNGNVDYQKLQKTVHLAVHFLDNVIDVNNYPLEQIEKVTKSNRRIGLGVMGWAEMLIMLKVAYDSENAVKLAEKLMKFINDEARKKSEELAKKRGSFPNISGSTLNVARNATVTTIAPTGTISIIADVTSGIEPIFAVCYVRNVMEGMHLLETNRLFEQVAREKGFYSKSLMAKIAKTGSVQNMKGVPKDVQRLFRTANEIPVEWHIRMQAAFQKYCENAVSKTVNLPNSATKKDVEKAYLLAWKLKCKGITVYRDGSKEGQVLVKGENISAEQEFSGGHLCKECIF